MKHILIPTLFAMASLFGVSVQDKNTCVDFQQSVKTIYNFKPSRLTKSEQTIKSKAMDQFWETVRANPKQLLPCLRTELQNSNADRWFRFDASNLLVELDPSYRSKEFQVHSYTDADLDDVDLRTWVSLLALRGFEGFDVSEAGSRWLAYPQAKYFLPEHGGYEVKAFQAALFIFGSMDESQATPALVKIVSQTGYPGRDHALRILMNQATPESLRALKQVDAKTFSNKIQSELHDLLNGSGLLKARPKPKTSRQEFVQAFQDMLNGDSSKFMELVSKVPDGEKGVVAVLKPEDISLVRKIRRMIIAGGNQHSIEYYNSFTEILLALVWKPELVK